MVYVRFCQSFHNFQQLWRYGLESMHHVTCERQQPLHEQTDVLGNERGHDLIGSLRRADKITFLNITAVSQSSSCRHR